MCQTDGTWSLVGITSWGVECGQPGVPGVYAGVQAALPWITEILGQTPLFPPRPSEDTPRAAACDAELDPVLVRECVALGETEENCRCGRPT